MKRIDVAFKKLEGLTRSKIVHEYCPYDVDCTFPCYDLNTFKFTERESDSNGCRGIKCEECWELEI